MPILQETEINNPINTLADIPLEKLTFIGSIIFFVGSIISVYVAYQNLKNINPTT